MFVVKKSEAANKTVRLPLELIEELNRIAVDKGVSFNSLVLQCITYALADMQDTDETVKKTKKKP